MILSLNDILLAACRAHTPQFDRMDDDIKKYAIEQMRVALIVAVTDLVKAGRSILDYGADPEDGQLDAALEPFEELIPYESTVEADISAAMSTPSPQPRAAIAPAPDLASENERLREALIEAWFQANLKDGMKVEQARFHAQTRMEIAMRADIAKAALERT